MGRLLCRRWQLSADCRTVVAAHGTTSGYRGVVYRPKLEGNKPYQVNETSKEGKRRFLGSFATAEEGALCFARHLGADAAEEAAAAAEDVVAATEAAPTLSAEDALKQAEAEGLVLEMAPGSATGFKGVTRVRGSNRNAFQVNAEKLPGGKRKYLGSFATAEEGALCFARHRRAIQSGSRSVDESLQHDWAPDGPLPPLPPQPPSHAA